MAKNKASTARRFYASRCQQGMDGVQAEISLTIDGADMLSVDEEPLLSKGGKNIGKIRCQNGKVSVYINPVHCIRPNNCKPFGVVDAIKIEIVRSMVLEAIREYLKKYLQNEYSDESYDLGSIEVMQAECNLTLKVKSPELLSNVVDMFEKAFDKTTTYRKRKRKQGFEKKTLSCSTYVPKKYFVKIYDKTEEQHEKGNPAVERNLLRIEFKFYNEYLKRVYKDKTLNAVLTREGLAVLCREYKTVFEEVENKYIKPYLNYCVQTVFESLTSSETGNEIAETVARHKDLIVDMEVLRKALKRWYTDYKHIEDRSSKVVYYYKKNNFGIPIGVLETLKMFHNAAG
ncbi:hypothetical protein [Bilifractor porci]|uniref:Uncharacterized protein n=1 Tax=Bilifractor porci TaxID=2606636 RepID=A0A7X2TPZ3_9FIRM|nr:hypothetical protein [Bilifractor porci]MST82493.1 hypothetical protein [Bilifractor porci]